MRLLLAVIAACWLLTTPPARGEQAFPYRAYVVTDDVYVRSGPGQSYYPTCKLKAGHVVEVYRHDPGGWYAIRPVDGSFSWVSGRYLDLGEDNLATVKGERVAARVGSRFSPIRDVIQVRLARGEVVELADRQSAERGPAEKTWYKIAPPSGEKYTLGGGGRRLSAPADDKPRRTMRKVAVKAWARMEPPGVQDQRGLSAAESPLS